MDRLWALLRDREPAEAMRAWVLEISRALLQALNWPPAPPARPRPSHPRMRMRTASPPPHHQTPTHHSLCSLRRGAEGGGRAQPCEDPDELVHPSKLLRGPSMAARAQAVAASGLGCAGCGAALLNRVSHFFDEAEGWVRMATFEER